MKEFFVKWLEGLEKGKEWWSNLAIRERRMLSVGGLLLAIFIVYQGMWSPLLEQVTTMRHHLDGDQHTLLWMQAADKEIRLLETQSKHRISSSTPVALLSILQSKVNQAGLSSQLTQLKQASQETIVMQFQKVEFDIFIQWLVSVMKEHTMSIAQLSVIADNAPGVVNVDMTIQLS